MQYIQLKDGSYLEAPDNASDADIKIKIEKIQGQNKPGLTWPQELARNLAIGAAKTGQNISNIPASLISAFNPQLGEFAKRKTDMSEKFGLPEKDQGNYDKLIQMAPELAGAMFTRPLSTLGKASQGLGQVLPRAGKYIDAAIRGAIPQGLFSAATSSGDRKEAGAEAAAIMAPISGLTEMVAAGSPVTRNIAKGALALGAGGAGYAGGKATGQGDLVSALIGTGLGASVLKGKSLLPNAKKDVFEGVAGSPYQESLDAAKRLGLKYITPAEASGTPYTGAVQGSLGKTAEGSKLYLKEGTERLASEAKAIQKLKETIYDPEKLNKLKTSLYKEVNPATVSEKKLQPLYDNEVFKQAINKVETDPSTIERLKGVPKNSIEYMQEVKEILGTMQFEQTKATGKQSRTINDVRTKLIDVLDDASPKYIDTQGKEVSLYKEARSLAEREIAKNKVDKFFNKRKETGSNFSKFLSDKKNYDLLQQSLRDVPEAQQQIKDMKLVFEKLINVPTAKMASAQASTSMSKARSTSQDWKTMLKEMLSGGKYDKQAIELMTNPNWADELAKMNKISDSEKLASKFVELVGKASAQGISKQKEVEK